MSEKKKKPLYKKWWFWVLAIIIVASVASGGGESDNQTQKDEKKETTETASTTPKEEKKKEEPKKEEKKLAGIGEPMKVGDVVFTVHGTSTAASVGPEGVGKKAQGTYLIIDVSVKNEGKKAITTDSSFFKLKSGETEYEADAAADIYVNEDGGGFFLQKVNPGIENKGKIVFDVPADVANSKDLILNVQTGFFGTEQGQIKLLK
jgi:hypothetical protein